MYKPKKTPSDYALDHFDNYYKPVFGSLWPSMRLALLSEQKYCALLNNFAEGDEQIAELISTGADNFLLNAEFRELNIFEEELLENHNKLLSDAVNKTAFNEAVATTNESDYLTTPGAESSDLHSFMPGTELVVASEKYHMKEQEHEQSIYIPTEVDISVLPGAFPALPFHFKALAYEMKNISMFPPARRGQTGKLNYYLMDAASLLPVLALDLEPGCSVLDLCAAPGGKSLAILQTMLPGKLSCVDHSWSRINRLKTVLRDYLPKSYRQDGMVDVFHGSGFDFVLSSSQQFDRVLVDVPCFTDRHVLHQSENNIFRPSRLSERLQIQNKQQDLLFHGIKACKPGGTVVYSTCTLAPPQNDGVIQAVLERIWTETNMSLHVAIEDAKIISMKFQDTFHFYDKCRFGQLVIPKITANFGPLYFCKMRRIS